MISPMQSTSVSSRTYDRQKISKRHKGDELVELEVGNKEFTIDEDDYNAIKAIRSPISWKTISWEKAGRSPTGWKTGDDFDERDSDSEENCDERDWDFSFNIGNVYDIRSTSVSHRDDIDKIVFEFSLDDDEERVSYLRILRVYGSMWELPEALWKLNALRVLDLSRRTLEIIPASIGKLQNLEELNLCGSRVRELPEELWDIPTLRVLDLSHSERLELPAPVRKVPYLRELILENTCADVASSIGRLQNLEKLILVTEDFDFFYKRGFSRKIYHSKLMEEIGKLSNLKTMELGFWDGNLFFFPAPHMCESLLSSLDILANLQQIKYLDLSPFDSLLSTQLEFIKKLPKLKFLYLPCVQFAGATSEDEQKQRTCECILDLVREIPYLGEVNQEFEDGSPKLTYALASNRLKYRVPFERSPLLNKLWPRMLREATGAFRRFHGRKKSDSKQPLPKIESHDALHKLLRDSRASFVEVLLHRKTNSSSIGY